MALSDYLKDSTFVSVNRLKNELNPDQVNNLLQNPQMPYLSLQFLNNKYQLNFNKGPVYAFLTDDAFDYEIETLFEEIEKFDALYDQQIYKTSFSQSQPLQPQQEQITEEPVQKQSIDTAQDQYQIQTSTKINSEGIIATTKVEKKVKQSSIMGFLKKK